MNITNGFKIIGISVRTTNKNNKSQEDLKELWRRFYAENVLENVPNKISNDVISIYTDYESNYTEAYTAIIGIQVSTLENIPSRLIGREFQPEKFKKFVAKGEMPNAVVKTWIDIWNNDKELNRKYTYDFEIYGKNSQKEENSEVEIYISVNN